MGLDWPRRLYTAAFYATSPLVASRLLYRSRKAPAYSKRWLERIGIHSLVLNRVIWIHAVSVGEVVAATKLIEALLVDYPDRSILVTTMTPTGSDRVKALFGDQVHHVYLPYDLPLAIDQFLKHVCPSILLIMETELWPNWIDACDKRAIPVLLVNARLSEKSSRGYQRVGYLARPMLRQLSGVLAQNKSTADRFITLGVPAERVIVTGSLKIEASATDDDRQLASDIRSAWGENRTVLLLASSHEGEDALLVDQLASFFARYDNALVVFVPRHPERFDSTVEFLNKKGYSTIRRSEQARLKAPLNPNVQVVVGDTMGELMHLMGAADVVIMGGSFVPVGGHNVLESLIMGTPVIIGPYYFNFADLVDELDVQNGLSVVADMAEALRFALWLLDDPNEYQAQLAAAHAYIASKAGVLGHVLECVASYMGPPVAKTLMEDNV